MEQPFGLEPLWVWCFGMPEGRREIFTLLRQPYYFPLQLKPEISIYVRKSPEIFRQTLQSQFDCFGRDGFGVGLGRQIVGGGFVESSGDDLGVQ